MAMQRSVLDLQVTAVITGLPRSLRAVFVMAYVERRSHQEIAAALGISERGIYRRMTKALSVCQARLVSRGIDLADNH